MLQKCLLADSSANDMAISGDTLVPHLVRISISITLLAIVHMYQEYKSGTFGTPYAYTMQSTN